MLADTYIGQGKFALVEKPKPALIESTDAIVRVTMSSICTGDLHIKHGSVPRAVPGITIGHEMVGVVEEVGTDVIHVKPGDRTATTHKRGRQQNCVKAIRYNYLIFHSSRIPIS